MPQKIVEMKQIVKQFPGIIANDHVNLTVFAGEVHALLGENGAGKTTLMNILSGKYKPDSGTILINGQKISMTPKNAIKHGIARSFCLVGEVLKDEVGKLKSRSNILSTEEIQAVILLLGDSAANLAALVPTKKGRKNKIL